MTRPTARRTAALLVVPLLWLGGCGDGTSDEDAGSGSATEDGGGGVDLEAPGDDLLSDSRWGGPVPGDTVEGSWRFPESYEPTGEAVPNNEATSSDGETEYTIQIGATPGVDQVDAAAADLAAGAEEAGQDVEQETLSIDGREFVSVTQENEDGSRRNLFYAPDEGNSFFLVVLTTNASLDETPEERVAEYYQTAASLEVETAG